jgi:hypothetical protein
MTGRFFRILVAGGALFGFVVLIRRTAALRGEVTNVSPSPDGWRPITFPEPPARAAWVPANEDGTCPATHLVKAKVASGLYHLPGMFAYDRTKPDRCYADEAAATADGFTKAKR